MSRSPERTLKSMNFKWLAMLAAADVSLIALVLAPTFLVSSSVTQAGLLRLSMASVMPLLVLLLVNVLPHDIKACLVYWKPRGWLPGREAFSKYGPSDSRIDMVSLSKHVGVLPTDPKEQDSKWYKLYLLVGAEASVTEAHKSYLLYRDMAAISALLLVVTPVPVLWFGSKEQLAAVAGVLALQYLLTALSARWSGIRLVCSVLAVHSARKVPSKPAAKPS